MNSSVNWLCLRKELVNLKICQQKLPELKCKEKKDYEENGEEHLRTVRQFQRVHHTHNTNKRGISIISTNKRGKNEAEEIFEVKMADKFPD